MSKVQKSSSPKKGTRQQNNISVAAQALAEPTRNLDDLQVYPTLPWDKEFLQLAVPLRN